MKTKNSIQGKGLLVTLLIPLFCLFPALHVHASDWVSIFDGAGHLLEAQEGEVRATGDVIFELDEDLLSEGEQFVCSRFDQNGEEGIPLPVPDGEWTEEEGEDVTLRFSILDEKDGSLQPLEAFPEGICSVFFLKDVSLSIETSFTAGESTKAGGTVCYRGDAPVLTVSPREGLASFVRISDETGSKKYEITKEDTRFCFGEGSYGVSVWCENGRGETGIMNLPANRFIYDNTPPAAPLLSLEAENGASMEGTGSGIYAGNIRITPSAADPLSGLDTFLFAFSDGTSERGSSLILEPDSAVSLTVYALDRAGNLSKGVESGKLILDRSAPSLLSDRITTDRDSLYIDLSFEDLLSGLGSLSLSVDGEKVSSRTISDRQETSSLKVTLKKADLGEGTLPLKAVVLDRAGNRAVYSFDLKNEDLTAPLIKMEGIENLAVLDHTGELLCSCEDGDSGIERAVVAIEKRDAFGVCLWTKEVSPGRIRFEEEGNYSVTFSARDHAGNRSARSRSFTIDTEPPSITSLEAYHKKILSSFVFPEDPGGRISDYSFVTYQLYLNGKEYDGRNVEAPGKYVLRLRATDEFGRESQEKAEFIISANEVPDEAGAGSVSGSFLPEKPPAAPKKLLSVKAVKAQQNRGVRTEPLSEKKPPFSETENSEEAGSRDQKKNLSLTDRFLLWLERVIP